MLTHNSNQFTTEAFRGVIIYRDGKYYSHVIDCPIRAAGGVIPAVKDKLIRTYDWAMPLEAWRWMQASEVAEEIGMGRDRAKIVAKILKALNGDRRKRGGGRDLLAIPPKSRMIVAPLR